MTLVDVNNIIKQTKEIEEKELDQKEQTTESQRLINPPKRNFWQRLFGKRKNKFASLPRFSGDNEEELKKIIALRKQLRMDDLPVPTKPHFEKETISPINEKKKSTSDEELSVFEEETNHESINIPSKDKLQNLRFKLGLDKNVVNTKHLYDKLEEQSNKDLDKQSEQYDKEQSKLSEESLFESAKTSSTAFQEQKKQEELITSKYKEPLEIEDKELFEKQIGVSESLTNDELVNLAEEPIPFEAKEESFIEEPSVKKVTIEKEAVNFEESPKSEVKPEPVVKLLKDEKVKTEALLSSNPKIFEEEQLDSKWSTKDETIDKEFPEESAKTLEEENFIISEAKTNEPFIEPEKISKQTPELVSEKEATISKEDVSKKELLSENVDEQLEETSNILEELKHGEVPVEDLVHHLELGVKQCNDMIQEKLFLDAKYKYNELCKIFEQTTLEDDERSKWFGVLRKTYERIIEAERF